MFEAELASQPGATRGAKEALAYLDEQMPIDEVPDEVVQEGKRLLTDVGPATSSRAFNDEQIQQLLQNMIKNSSFEGARVEVRDYEKFGSEKCHDSMMTTFGKEPGAYNVWFERDSGSWVLACNKVPVGGNLRSL